jgi:hypothetical protein
VVKDEPGMPMLLCGPFAMGTAERLSRIKHDHALGTAGRRDGAPFRPSGTA